MGRHRKSYRRQKKNVHRRIAWKVWSRIEKKKDQPMHIPSEILRFFAYGHLPAELQIVSERFAIIAEAMDRILPKGAEKAVCLRKLLEAKDAAVRAALTEDSD